jgi:polar amino acid transport system substrate-binding protein
MPWAIFSLKIKNLSQSFGCDIKCKLALLLLVLLPLGAFSDELDWLSEQQKSYLKENSVIPICVDPKWAPIEWIDQEGLLQGVSKDYLDVIATMLQIEFDVINTSTWSESEELLLKGDCLLVPSITQTAIRKEQMVFTPSYFDAANVVVTQQHVDYLSDMTQLNQKSVSMVKDYAVTEFVKSTYPRLLVLERENIELALLDVVEGNADAAIGLLLATSHTIQQSGFSSLKLNSKIDFTNQFRFGFNQHASQLRDIVQLALDRITSQQKSDIINRWYKVQFDYKFSRAQITYFTITILVIGLFAVFHHFTVRRMYKRLQETNLLLENKHRELKTISEQDRLTEVFNRVKLESVLSSELSRSQRYDNPLVLMILDIDFFKKVNDEHGHLIGDQVLMSFAEVVSGVLRKIDVFGRWGGEEFLVICPQTDINNSTFIAKKILEKVRNHDFPNELHITCSIGICEYKKGETENSFVERADRALYKAKREGRNQFVISTN